MKGGLRMKITELGRRLDIKLPADASANTTTTCMETGSRGQQPFLIADRQRAHLCGGSGFLDSRDKLSADRSKEA